MEDSNISNYLWAHRAFGFCNQVHITDGILGTDNKHGLSLQAFNEDYDAVDEVLNEDENDFYDEEVFADQAGMSNEAATIVLDTRFSSSTFGLLASEVYIFALVLSSSSVIKSSFCDLAVSDNFSNRFISYVFKSKLACATQLVCAGVLNSNVFSLSSIIPATEWAEREAGDMNGLFFVGSWDLRRILTDYGFRFFPMLKHVPLSGYAQCVYDEYSKVVSYEPIELSQGFRA